mgnify:CR=1 FL=1
MLRNTQSTSQPSQLSSQAIFSPKKLQYLKAQSMPILSTILAISAILPLLLCFSTAIPVKNDVTVVSNINPKKRQSQHP